MTTYEPSPQFQAAVAFLSHGSSSLKVTTATKLELYGLFKWLTVSPNPNTSRPSIFDLTGRAKWDAWKSAGTTYTEGAEVEKRYLQIARDLGWTEGTTVVQNQPEADEDEEINWDEDDVPSKGSSKPSGLGPSVSVMANDEEEIADKTIHDCAISGNLEKLEELFRENPKLNPNELDDNGYTALHLASDRGNVSVVKFLLTNGADSTIKDEDGMTPAALAEVVGHHEIFRLLSNP